MTADCSIDYERLAAPPILLPPASIRPAELGGWLAHCLGAQRVFATYSTSAAAAADRVYCRSTGMDVRRVSGTAGASLLPIDRFGADADELHYPDVEAALAGRPGREYHGFTASWLPLPCVEDDALIAVWPPAPPEAQAAQQDLLPSPVGPAGAAAGYLIATDGTALAGELDPLLLRAPCAGLVGVDRYRHLVLADGRLAAGLPSRSGRVLVQASPPTVFDKEQGAVEAASPLAQPATFTFEHVDVETCASFLALLVEHHVAGYTELRDAARFRQDATLLGRRLDREVQGALTAWYHACSLPAVRALEPAMAMPSSVESAIRDELIDRADPSAANLRRAAEATAGDAGALGALRAFLSQVYAPMLTGRTWRTLGVDLGAQSGPAAEYLSDFEALGDKWVVCYAGAPLGRPAEIYGPAPTGSPKETYHESLTAFEVEALYVLQDQLTFDWARRVDSPPAARDDVAEYAADQLDRSASGHLVTMRVSEPSYADAAFSATDWLAEAALGHQRQVRQPALHDFTVLAGAGHPLAPAMDWGRRRLAADARAQMDLLADHRVGGSRLQAVSLGWWSRIRKWTDPANPGMWGPFGGFPEQPRHADPYRRSGDSTPGRAGAFDELDLYAAVVAAAATRDGKGGGRPTHPAVVLAVSHTEGYRNYHRERLRELWVEPYPPHLGADPPVPIDTWEPDVEAWKIAMTRAWWENTHGLDFCNKRRLSPADVEELLAQGYWSEQPGEPGYDEYVAWSTTTGGRNDLQGRYYDLFGSDFVSGSRAYFEYAEAWTKTTNVGTAGPHPIVVPDFFGYGGFRPRVESLLSCGETDSGLLLMGRRTRELQAVVQTMSMAIFEAHHSWVHTGRTYDDQELEEVPEYRSAELPPVGDDAASDDRKRFIAYYAGVYLAYNSSPTTWNAWFRRARENKEPTRTVPEQFLFGLSPGKDSAYNSSIGNVLRFCTTLDAYLRLNLSADGLGAPDLTDPHTRTWTAMR